MGTNKKYLNELKERGYIMEQIINSLLENDLYKFSMVR